MTRWALVADLNRCVGCQTCTAACKHANGTAPGVQWRRVLDIEAGVYPDVRRAFVPVGCMHCDEPPCRDVCPTTATRKRTDGIVTIDYDLCIGCAYCAVACPYQARWRIDRPQSAYGNGAMRHEALREDPALIGVAQKCTFCVERINRAQTNGQVPGSDQAVTPACVASCIAGALHFGDIDDRNSTVAGLLAANRHFRMHEELGTGPGIYYLWSAASEDDNGSSDEPTMVAEPVGMAAVAPEQQQSWDWRAAANFMLGGAGSGLLVAAAAMLAGPTATVPIVLALVLVALGLLCVWLEIGRPWRFINVFFHPQRSWMTREAIAALPLFALGLVAIATGSTALAIAAGACGLVFLYCQARLLQAAKGVPVWRHRRIVLLMVITGLAEGLALLALYATITGTGPSMMQVLAPALLLLVGLRYAMWRSYRGALGAKGAPTGSFKALDDSPLRLTLGHQLFPMVIVASGLLLDAFLPASLTVAALFVLASGWLFKFTLITRAGFNQGFAVERMPARGGGDRAPGIKPGWTLS